MLTWVFWLLFGLVTFTTLAPLSGSARWWIRGWDFPRVHIAVTGIACLVLGLVLNTTATFAGAAVMAACVVYQLVRVFPYTCFAKTEIDLVSLPKDRQVSFLAVNVLMENDDHSRLRTIIDREDPDVLLLMETDSVWQNALSAQLERYSTVVRHPLSNHYGMLFATRLKTHAANTVFLSDDDTPTLLADLEAPSGRFYFVGLHPRPPTPGVHTDKRDEQIERSARLADRAVFPVVAMGDFNDVAWSRTSENFKNYGAFRDPRIGRGMLPSFDARSWFLRLPIDQLYITEGIDLVSFKRLESIGSDHFPMKAIIGITPQPDGEESFQNDKGRNGAK